MLKIGIVGAGAIGESHKNAIMNNPQCSLVAVCDLDVEKAKILAEGTVANIYTDYMQMQESENLDAVILNLPHFLHKDVSVYFLKNKIAVLVEKPMANSVAECEEMITAAEESNVPLGIGHIQKYYKCYTEFRKIVDSGELGKFCHMTETRNIDYFTNRPLWFLDKNKSGGGIVMNYAAHTLDKLFYVLDSEIVSVTAVGNNFYTDVNVEASAQVLLKFSDGSSASLTYCGCKVPQQYETYFYFTNGVAKIIANKLYISKNGNDFEEVELIDKQSVFDTQLSEFVKLINGEESQLVNPNYGKRIIGVIEKIYSQFDM